MLTWVLIYLLTEVFYPLFINFIPNFNIAIPLIIIIVTGFFGILYIRNIEENEVVEGILIGMVFIIIDIMLDYIVFILPQHTNIIVENYFIHLISMIIITLLITTFLGYLAQMKIDLK
ncbi:hypothetical protein [Methanobrevibacter sp.]|uniref:hypothetical protein n=1 Tax=Methanobrevibacter sp. TaxID=66852 RepID=UPI0025D0371B|nr:hypothetical protein [Methanobrevibacter sp.]